MKKSETYSSGWLKSGDMLDQGLTRGMDLTITGVRSAKMDDGKPQRVLTFHEDTKELGLNATNWDEIANMTGKDDDDLWIGTVINAYPHKLDRPFNGHAYGIRIQQPQGVGPAKTTISPARAIGNTMVNEMEVKLSARKAAASALELNMQPGATREEKIAAWNDAMAKACPGKIQAAFTSADWGTVKAFIEGYPGEAPPMPPALPNSDLPF